MNDPTCKDCQHFRQHYIHFLQQRYDAVPCGHCVYPRLKHRHPDTPACVHFQQKNRPRHSLRRSLHLSEQQHCDAENHGGHNANHRQQTAAAATAPSWGWGSVSPAAAIAAAHRGPSATHRGPTAAHRGTTAAHRGTASAKTAGASMTATGAAGASARAAGASVMSSWAWHNHSSLSFFLLLNTINLKKK